MLTIAQRRTLLQHGFIKYEVNDIDRNLRQSGAAFDLTCIPWTLALETRATLWLRLLQRYLDKGFTKIGARDKVVAEIRSYYKQNKKASPWDWVKKEYRPPPKLKEGGFEKALKRRTDMFLAASQKHARQQRQAFISPFIEKVQTKRGR